MTPDIVGPKGSYAVSAANGKVINIRIDSYGGRHVFIKHKCGLITKYEHSSKKILVKVGDKVKAGQKILKIGKSGLVFVEEGFRLLGFGMIQKNSEGHYVYINPRNFVTF